MRVMRQGGGTCEAGGWRCRKGWLWSAIQTGTPWALVFAAVLSYRVAAQTSAFAGRCGSLRATVETVFVENHTHRLT